ncbi:uncharacterized protein LOC144933726 isoform X3 [Lampetra fluviatilis]
MEEKKREVIQRHHKLEEAQLQIQKEMDLGKLLSQTITALRQEKQETNKALEESQRLIERQSVHVNRTKEDNVALLQENQALKGDNEKLNGHMMEKDENCKSIKGRFENTKITLEEEDSVGKKLHAASTLHATAPVCGHPGPSVGLKAKHNVTGVELVAFSDDEEDNWAIGNQITDIQKFLNVDRLKLTKK